MKNFYTIVFIIAVAGCAYFAYQYFNKPLIQTSDEIEQKYKAKLDSIKQERDSIAIRQAILEQNIAREEVDLSSVNSRLNRIQRSISDLAKNGIVSGGDADSTVRDLHRRTTIGFSKWQRFDSVVTYGKHSRDSIANDAGRQLDSIRRRTRLSINEERQPEIQLSDSL